MLTLLRSSFSTFFIFCLFFPLPFPLNLFHFIFFFGLSFPFFFFLLLLRCLAPQRYALNLQTAVRVKRDATLAQFNKWEWMEDLGKDSLWRRVRIFLNTEWSMILQENPAADGDVDMRQEYLMDVAKRWFFYHYFTEQDWMMCPYNTIMLIIFMLALAPGSCQRCSFFYFLLLLFFWRYIGVMRMIHT